ncbi:hypothetical protein BpHYR1_038225, partial [Brachionus plicatilis]
MANYRIRNQIIEHYARKNFIKMVVYKKDASQALRFRLHHPMYHHPCSTLEHKSQKLMTFFESSQRFKTIKNWICFSLIIIIIIHSKLRKYKSFGLRRHVTSLTKLDKPVSHKTLFSALDIALNQDENDAITSNYNFWSNK